MHTNYTHPGRENTTTFFSREQSFRLKKGKSRLREHTYDSKTRLVPRFHFANRQE